MSVARDNTAMMVLAVVMPICLVCLVVYCGFVCLRFGHGFFCIKKFGADIKDDNEAVDGEERKKNCFDKLRGQKESRGSDEEDKRQAKVMEEVNRRRMQYLMVQSDNQV